MSGGLWSLPNERVAWGGKKGGDDTDERDSDRCSRRGKKSRTVHTYITCTSRIDFAVPPRLIRRCGNVNQNGNENLCNSNWIYTDEGHFIGQEAGPNSQNEDWFCDSFSPLPVSLSRRPPCVHAHTHTHRQTHTTPLQRFLLYFLEHTSIVWIARVERLTKTASGITYGALWLYK